MDGCRLCAQGYHFPAVMVRCKRAPAVRAIVHCHANACDMGHIFELCQRDAECWQANVLLVEYPGYGASPGVSYERSVDRHVMAAYLYLTEELKYKPESVVLFGRSLGSGPVCRLAQRLQAAGSSTRHATRHTTCHALIRHAAPLERRLFFFFFPTAVHTRVLCLLSRGYTGADVYCERRL